MKLSLNIAALCGAALLLQACVSSPPSPALVEASLPSAATPPSVSGALLEQCFSEGFTVPGASQRTVATYDPAVTLGFARQLARYGGAGAAYAPRIRAYVAKPYFKGLLREGYAEVACFYELHNGQLRYLSVLRLYNGRVRSDDMYGAMWSMRSRLGG
jgi:hypothetical protein